MPDNFKPFANCEYSLLKTALICSPTHLNSSCKYSEVAVMETNDGISQHSNLSNLLQTQGVNCLSLEPSCYLPYQCFVRDSMAVTPWGLLITKMSTKFRFNETQILRDFAAKFNMQIWREVEDGTLEGGDLLLLKPGLAVVGFNKGRTDYSTALTVKSWFEDKGWNCRVVEYPEEFVHLDVAMGVLDAHNIICGEDIFDPSTMEWFCMHGFNLLPIPDCEVKNFAANVLSLDGNRIVCSMNNYVSKSILLSKGFKVLELDISFFISIQGGVHCLTLPLVRENPVMHD